MPEWLKEARLSQPSALQRRVLTRSMSFSLCCPQKAPWGSPGRLYLASVPQPSCWHTRCRTLTIPSSRCVPQRAAGVMPGKLKLGSLVHPAGTLLFTTWLLTHGPCMGQ